MLGLNRFALTAILAATSLCWSATAMANLKSHMQAFLVVVADDGKLEFKPATQAKPGQTIEYRMVHTNTFDHAIGGLMVLGPIPTGAEFVSAGQDTSAVMEVRGDFDPEIAGEEWSTLPAKQIVIAPDGEREEVPADPGMFTAVRWQIKGDLPSEGSIQHTYRVKVQ